MFERCKPYVPPEDYLPLISSSFAILAPSIISSSTNLATVATSVIKIFACITSSSPSTSLHNRRDRFSTSIGWATDMLKRSLPLISGLLYPLGYYYLQIEACWFSKPRWFFVVLVCISCRQAFPGFFAAQVMDSDAC